MNQRERESLDQYITGHWGEDLYRDEEQWDDFLDRVFSDCIFEKLGQCHALKMCNDQCLVVKGYLDKYESEMRENDCPEVCMCCDEDWKTCTKDPNVCEDEQWEEYAQCQYEGRRES